MTVPARHTSAAHQPDSGFEQWRLAPDERIGLASGGSRVRRFLVRSTVLLVLLGGGWAAMNDDTLIPWLASVVRSAAGQTTGRAAPEKIATPAPSPLDKAVPAASVVASGIADPQMGPAGSDSAASPAVTILPTATGTAPLANSRATDLTVTPAAPPAIGNSYAEPSPVSDPLAERATRVGLHAQLSRVLLARLSPADFQNAGVAISMAVAETPDDGVLVWPKQRKPELALFKVHFVPGAAPDCRRYVVTISKDGWSTTALPMERCGVRRGPGTQGVRR